MNAVNVLGIALGLAMDAFAVAIASSVVLGKVGARQYFRLAFHFGLFQFLMPILGWLLGSAFVGWLGAWDHWIAFGLLSFIGGKMIWEAVRGGDGRPRGDPTRGVSLVMLSLATSMDALAVGISFAMLEASIWIPCIVIGLVAAALTALGLRIGSSLGSRFGHRMEIIGGLVLVGIGVRILVDHLGVG